MHVPLKVIRYNTCSKMGDACPMGKKIFKGKVFMNEYSPCKMLTWYFFLIMSVKGGILVGEQQLDCSISMPLSHVSNEAHNWR